MRKFCEIMVIVYIVLFIPVAVYAKMFGLMSFIGIENVNQTIAWWTRTLMEYFPVVIFVSAGAGYALNVNEKYNISAAVLVIPILVFFAMWTLICIA